MTKPPKKSRNLLIIFFYVFIAVLIACFVVVTVKIALSPTCSSDVRQVCIIDTWSIAGLTSAVFGIAAALLTFLGAFAVAYWWANLDQKVDTQVEKRTNELIDNRIQAQETKFQTQIAENVKAFNTQVAQLEANFQTQIEESLKKLDTQIAQLEGNFQFIRKEVIIATMFFPPWEIDSWARELLLIDPTSEVASRMVMSYLDEVDNLLPDPARPPKKLGLRLIPNGDPLYHWNKALEWRELVKKQNIPTYLHNADWQLDQRRSRIEAYIKQNTGDGH